MTETQNKQSWKERVDEVIEAKNLKNAKRQATKKHIFQGTVLNLYSDKNQENLLARKIDGKWRTFQQKEAI